jgi:hypothetical protein
VELLRDGEVALVTFARHGLWLRLSVGADDHTLHIGGPFRLLLGGEDTLVNSDEGPHPAYLPLAGLMVERVSADDDGRLTVAFVRGDSLVIEPDAHYEAWDYARSDGSVIVCLPGGQLSTWSATGSAAGPAALDHG